MNAPIMLARAGQMTEQEYDKERARFSRRLYRVNSIEAAAKRDQALAILFYRSGWPAMRAQALDEAILNLDWEPTASNSEGSSEDSNAE
jgi:hypothetical protein